MSFVWSTGCQKAFDLLKSKLSSAPILVYPNFDLEFVLETDASVRRLGVILSKQLKSQLHPVAFASTEGFVTTGTELFYNRLGNFGNCLVMQPFSCIYLHGQYVVTIYTDDLASQAVLQPPSLNGKHARWWLKIQNLGAQKISIKYRPGKENQQADSLSRNPVSPAPVSGDAEDEVQSTMTTTAADYSQQIVPKSSSNTNLEDLASTQIGEVTRDGTMDALPDTISSERSSSNDFADLLQLSPVGIQDRETFRDAQKEDPYLSLLIDCMENGKLPEGPAMSKRVLALSPHLVMINKLLHFVDTDSTGGVRQRVCVPRQFQQQILQDSHGGFFSGHFSDKRLYSTLCRRWWWDRMYSDALEYCKSCPECATVTGGGRIAKPPLHSIHVECPFQILGVDVMELPKTTSGNKYVLVFQDYLTKWPMVYAKPDQKSTRIVDILVHEGMPIVGVPESLLSDRGNNLLSFIMKDVCNLLGIEKNTTAYHTQCDGLVEQFNSTLKTMLRKHAARYGNQWDKYLSAVVWSYRNTPHEATREKPSFSHFEVDLHSPTETTYLPPTELSASLQQMCQIIGMNRLPL